MWFLTLQQLQITQQVWSSCEHEYVLSCQVDRTPWPPAALSVPRAVERSCPEPLHPQTHTHRTSTSCCTQSKHHHRFLFFWSGLARRTACKPSSTTNETLQPKVICPPPHPLLPSPLPPHICVVSARARVLPTFPQRSDATPAFQPVGDQVIPLEEA